MYKRARLLHIPITIVENLISQYDCAFRSGADICEGSVLRWSQRNARITRLHKYAPTPMSETNHSVTKVTTQVLDSGVSKTPATKSNAAVALQNINGNSSTKEGVAGAISKGKRARPGSLPVKPEPEVRRARNPELPNTQTQIVTFDWSGILNELRSRCRVYKDGGHWIWKISESQIDSPFALSEFAFAGSPYIDRQHNPRSWFAMGELRDYFMVERHAYKIVTNCSKPNCISHFLRLKSGVTSVREFDHDLMQYHTARLQSKCAAPDPKTGCILFRGKQTLSGYGSFVIAAIGIQQAHMASWILWNGDDIPRGMCVCHLCNTPMCVNPRHLVVGTPKFNASHRKANGTNKVGIKSHFATITEDQAKEVIASKDTGETRQEKADRIGVSLNIVTKIEIGRAWCHLMPEGEAERRRSEHKKGPKLTMQQVQQIKSLKDTKTREERASMFGVSEDHIYKIDLGITHAKISADPAVNAITAEAERIRKMNESFERAKQTIKQRCVNFTDEDGEEHHLWDGCKKQVDDGTIRPRVCLFGRPILAQRAVWLIHHRATSLPEDKPRMLHRCRYKWCLRLEHLRPGTSTEDALDMIKDGTHRSGKLTKEQAAEILALKDSGSTGVEVAELYNVSSTTVYYIWAGKTWWHLDQPQTTG
jgi:hypothetical protein